MLGTDCHDIEHSFISICTLKIINNLFLINKLTNGVIVNLNYFDDISKNNKFNNIYYNGCIDI